MTILHGDTDKYEDRATAAPILEAFHGATKDLIRRKLLETGLRWEDFVFGASYSQISAQDFQAIDEMVLRSGYRYRGSAVISVEERPEAYLPMMEMLSGSRFSFEHQHAIVGSLEANGRQQRGQGDNVVQSPNNVIGTARYYRTIQDVMRGLTEGVPPNTIAVIDDSGGTLTAPILEKFAGVICAGGTIRSHLGILTREYGIPCLMNAQISGIFDGDEVELECSAPAKTNEAYQQGRDMAVRIWRTEPVDASGKE